VATPGTSHRGDDLVNSASVYDRSRHDDQLDKDVAALLLLIGSSAKTGGQPPLGAGSRRGSQRELVPITSMSAEPRQLEKRRRAGRTVLSGSGKNLEKSLGDKESDKVWGAYSPR
jgi:hypothetical protein